VGRETLQSTQTTPTKKAQLISADSSKFGKVSSIPSIMGAFLEA
jgi:hypothetical protein